MAEDDPFEVANSSGLTDADWAEINKLRRAYDDGGQSRCPSAPPAMASQRIPYAT